MSSKWASLARDKAADTIGIAINWALSKWDIATDLIGNFFDILFIVTAFILKPHYRQLNFPTKKTNKLLLTFQRIGLWIVLGVIYCGVFYVFVIDVHDPATLKIKTIGGKLGDFFNVPWKDITSTIVKELKTAIWSNAFFVFLFYKAVSSNAEKEFFRDHFEHHKISGLIKTIKIGAFDIESRYGEQNLSLVNEGRKHFHNLVENEEHQLITIVTASGWDFFGNPEKGKELSDKNPFPNGYLLKFLSQRNKRFEIMLIDPNSTSCADRAKSYLTDKSHKVLDEEKSYKENIESVLKNIATASTGNIHVTVKLLPNIPTWKLVKVDKEIWAQPIISGFRSDHTTLYGFKNKPNSIYHIFFNKIEDSWKSAAVLDLQKYRS